MAVSDADEVHPGFFRRAVDIKRSSVSLAVVPTGRMTVKAASLHPSTTTTVSPKEDRRIATMLADASNGRPVGLE